MEIKRAPRTKNAVLVSILIHHYYLDALFYAKLIGGKSCIISPWPISAFTLLSGMYLTFKS